MVDLSDLALTLWLAAVASILAVYVLVTPRPLRIGRFVRTHSETIAPTALTVLGTVIAASPLPFPWNLTIGGLAVIVGLAWLASALQTARAARNARKADLLRRGWAHFREIEALAEPLEWRIRSYNEQVATAKMEREPLARQKELNDQYKSLLGERMTVEQKFHRSHADQLYLFVKELQDQYGFDIEPVLKFIQAGHVRAENMLTMRTNLSDLLHALDRE